MTRYTLHVPRFYNDGTVVPPSELDLVEGRLLDIAGGFTSTNATGAWRSPDGRVYREPVTLYHVDSELDVERELRDVAELIAARLEQEAVYLTSADLGAELIGTGVPA